jgi:hypothetical protein
MGLYRYQPSLIRFSNGQQTGIQVVFQYLKPRQIPFETVLIKESPVLVNFRWDDNNDRSPDKVGAFGTTPIFSNCLSNHSQRWPNENKVNGIFTFQSIHITQLIFLGIQKHLIRSLFHDCLKPEDF